MASIIFVAMASPCLSQPYCKVRTFTIDDGLPANNISEFSLSPDGMMWVSTWNGLCNYDGYIFSRFSERFGAGQVLTSNRLKFIRPNSCGDIWCSTYDGKAYLFDCTTCRYIDLSDLVRPFYKHNFYVRNILSMGNGFAWVLGNGNINLRIDERTVKERRGITVVDTRKTVYDGPIRKVMTDDSGREWIFAASSVNLYGTRVHISYMFEYMCQLGHTVYFASRKGLFGSYSGRLRLLRLPSDVTAINGMCRFGKGLALATNIGVVVFSPSDLSSRVVSVQHPSQPSSEVKSLFTDSRGRLWAFASGPGVSLISSYGSDVRWLQAEAGGWMGTTSSSPVFHEDNNHTVWVVPTDGVFSYYDEARRCLVPYNLNAENSNRLPISYILKYKKDAQNNLWFTGNHNLTLVNFNHYRFKFTPSMRDADARSVMKDRSGRVWTGLHNGFVTVADASSGSLLYLSPSGRLVASPVRFTDKGVYTMAEDRKGNVWIGTKGRGIYVLRGGVGSGKVSHYGRNYDDKWSLTCDSIYDFCEDESGRMWVATYGGGINVAAMKSDGSLAFINSNNVMTPFADKSYNRMRRLALAPGGVMIASTFGGIVTLNSRVTDFSSVRYYYTTHIQGDTTSLMATDVLNTYVSRSTGRLYATTMGGGFQVASTSKLLRNNIPFRSVAGISTDEGLIQSVVEDASGNLWLVRESSVDKLYQKTGQCEIYGSNDWEEDLGFTEAQPYVSPRGDEIILGVIGGSLSFRPGQISKSRYKPMIVFSGVQFQGDRQITPILGKTMLDIPEDERNVTIFFSALDYNGNRLIRYAYKIKELDHDWSYTGMSHSASLSHIPAGKYTLVVRSTNSDGVWTDNARELKIYVHPTFWETGWAMLLYVLVALAIVSALFYVWRLRSNVAMEKRLKERQLRFFTGISHQLRTPLTLIDGPVGQVLSEEPLSAKARTYLQLVKKNSMRMLELVNKSLDLKKLDADADDANMAVPAADETAVFDDLQHNQTAVSGLDFASGRITVLIVEDNVELRYFLVSSLSSSYDIIEARNGEEGLQLASSRQPDFIITDIMMPVMDGMTMIRKIKARPETSHIPIVVLSARTAINYRIEGLNEGIDDYITKPFSMSYLKSRVDNIIRQRRQLQQAYVSKLNAAGDGHLIYKADSPGIADADKEFARRLVEYLEPRISDPDLKIDDITKAMALSRTVFYGKVKSLFGMSPIDFVRHMRILRAERLIVESRKSFSEIAYSVGFTDPKYFGRTFKAKTGMTPSDYRKKYSQHG